MVASRLNLFRAFQEFVKLESSAGILLLLATVLALGWANSPWTHGYFELWETEAAVRVGPYEISRSLVEWINEGLMVIFFLLVGLEIKREMVVGELSAPRQALLPVFAAAGGMAVPAAIYALFNAGAEGARGWGVPVATDIAFSLGVLALLGRRAPWTARVFLAAYAIADDLGAVLVIAIFYTGELSVPHLAFGGIVLAYLVGINLAGVRHAMAYVLPAHLLWLALLGSGVHASIAGVLLAFTIPVRGEADEAGSSLLHRMERALHPWVSFFILPLFALANAGVALPPNPGDSLFHPVTLGVALGLALGKPLGVLGGCYLSVRLKLAALPTGARWKHLLGAGLLGGIGFTMALFIAHLAFGDSRLLVEAKLGVFAGSLIAGLAGWAALRFTNRGEEAHPRRHD